MFTHTHSSRGRQPLTLFALAAAFTLLLTLFPARFAPSSMDQFARLMQQLLPSRGASTGLPPAGKHAIMPNTGLGTPALTDTPIATGTPPTATATGTPTATNTATNTPTITPTALPGCTGPWSVVPHPNSGQLSGVAAVSPNDVWATGPGATLHWDGSQWSYSTLPPQTGTGNKVAADAPNDVWLLGSTGVAQWNGSAWVPHAEPTPLQGTYEFYNIAARAPDDVWIVGHNPTNADFNGPVAFHWNGTNWGSPSAQRPESPGGGILYNGYYEDAWPTGPNDVWLGGYENEIGGPYTGPIVEHCTGGVCNRPGPIDVGDQYAIVYGVIAFGDSNVWAVGHYNAGSLIAHYDGSGWSVVPHPDVNTLYDLAGSGPTDIWAVGNGILHWDGVRWRQFDSPSGAVAVSATAPGDAWAAGVNLLHYQDTPLFSDVPRSNPFYTYMQALACNGVISGYADGTFRPGNNTTRGQLCKIVVNAEGWAIDTSGGPHFADVPPGSTFYPFVETAYNHGIISGYSDGTFRWNNSVTRGQLSKIVVNAEGWAIDTSGGPHFSDVPATDPFYAYIETAYHHAVISGYSDGTFRPGNNATRGQISKIVFNAVFGQ